VLGQQSRFWQHDEGMEVVAEEIEAAAAIVR
jgi:hypothetical protein